MQPFFQEPRPPYYEFEQRAIERYHLPPPHGDGTKYYAMIDYILITPVGSKDRYEQEVEPYFFNLEKLTNDGMFPPKWLADYKAKYKEWKETNSFEVSGTPLRNWPAATAAEVKVLLAANIRTVEDLAGANEAALARIGMGARSLQNRARDWVTAQANTAPLVEQLEALRRANAQLEARVNALQAQPGGKHPAVNPQAFVSAPAPAPAQPRIDASQADEALIDSEFSTT